ncbi:MAG TPA: DUF1488 family protein, partial [Ramlibacter sp.]|nr:DUF1488 family protein [Ramlibacter sp.]
LKVPMADLSEPAVPPFFHESSGTVRFWVRIGETLMGASVGRAALHQRFRPTAADDDPLDTFRAHLAEIEAVVRLRVAQGSIEPVMLREYDLRPAGAQGGR